MKPLLLASNGIVENVSLDALISLSDAGFPDAAYAMREIDMKNIEQLAESNPEEWPPLECVRVQIEQNIYYAVIDGYHRWETSAYILELNRIDVIARTYRDEPAVIDAAFQANLRHGLASNQHTRSAYAVWLYFHDLSLHDYPDYKPNISAIARKAGLDQSSASRAINRALKNTEAGTDTGVTEREHREDSHTNKLMKAVHTFFDGEHALLTSKTDERDTRKRAKALYNHIKRLPEEKQTLALLELSHVGAAINTFLASYMQQ